MLFDLRSRGRRRTVQVVYVGLAVLMASGLILFGVGTGGSGGGLFGAFTGNGASNGGSAAVNSQTKQAIAATKKNPQSASAWANLVAARFSAANSQGYDSSTSSYTKEGQEQLQAATQAYAQYSKLDSSPSPVTAQYAATAYGQLGQYAKAAATWQVVSQAQPSNLKYLVCVAAYSYAAKNDRVAGLAENKVLSKLSKTQAKEEKTELAQVKTSPAAAKQFC